MPKYIKEGDVIVALMDAPWWDDNDEDIAYDALDSVRAADVAEVRHGVWEAGAWRSKCSICGFSGSVFDEPVNPWKYCPNCGAKMDGKGEE